MAKNPVILEKINMDIFFMKPRDRVNDDLGEEMTLWIWKWLGFFQNIYSMYITGDESEPENCNNKIKTTFGPLSYPSNIHTRPPVPLWFRAWSIQVITPNHVTTNTLHTPTRVFEEQIYCMLNYDSKKCDCDYKMTGRRRLAVFSVSRYAKIM